MVGVPLCDVGPSPGRAERAILGVILGVFWLIPATFVVGELLCDVRTPLWALITLLRVVY